MPVVEVARAFFQGLGYEGWVSLELFSVATIDPDPNTPNIHAKRGVMSWGKSGKGVQFSLGLGHRYRT